MSTSDPEAIPATGNYTDKDALKSRVLRNVVRRFDECVHTYVERVQPRSLLDVGCAEGRRTARFARQCVTARVVGLDLNADGSLNDAWNTLDKANLEFVVADAASIPFADREFDVVTALELLEHVAEPGAVMSELLRVAQRYVIVSVPREPLWRVLNVGTRRHVRSWGNTPGHVNHWSTRRFVAFVADHAHIVDTRTPIPWTVVLARGVVADS